MTSERAARFIRSHGIDAWAMAEPRRVLAMDVTTERLPGGIVTRAVPVVLFTGLERIRRWLGY